jgi:protein required for attachment to host cells
MNVRIVVADERQANFFDTSTAGQPLAPCGSLQNAVGGLKDIDLETDRPGRRFGGASGHHHGVEGERSTERHATAQFAREVARKIEEGRVNHDFDKLVLVAGPRMLGLLRQELPETCRGILAGEVLKDLLQYGPDVIREVIPRDVFFH